LHKTYASLNEFTSEWNFSLSPDGSLIALSDGKLLDAQTGKLYKKLSIPEDKIHGNSKVIWSPDGQKLAYISGCFTIWDPFRDQLILSNDRCGYASNLAWSPDSQEFALLRVDQTNWNQLEVWDFKAQKIDHSIPLKYIYDWGSFLLAWSPDGASIGIAGELGQTYIVDRLDRSIRSPFQKDELQTTDLTWSSDGKLLATTNVSGSIDIIDTVTWKKFTSDRVGGPTDSVSFSPDNHYLAVGYENGDIGIWEMPEMREVYRLKGHTQNVENVKWSPDGKRIVSRSEDGTIRIWAQANQK
jgi:WD40 repeat protein